MRIATIIVFLTGLLGAAIFAFPERIEGITGITFCAPDFNLGNAEPVTSGADLGSTYRSKWLEMPYVANRTAPPATAKRICTATEIRGDCDFHSLRAALYKAKDGDVFVITKGIYPEAASIRANSVTLLAEHGAHIKGRAAEGTAALVIKGNDTTIEGLECSGIAVPDRNGSCIRLTGRNLNLRGVHFHDSEQGMLSAPNSGSVTIEYSLFERLGFEGYSHGLYMGGGPNSQLIVRHTFIIGTKDGGHGIKSRAASTLIEDSVVASLAGNDSRAIDLPNGGLNIIRHNVLQNGPNSVNMDVIGIGLELKERPANLDMNRTKVVDNSILLERFFNKIIHASRVPLPIGVNNNVVCRN